MNITLLLIIIIIIFLYIFIFYKYNKNIYIESNLGTTFLVYKDKFQIEKANMLEQIVRNMYILKNHLLKNINNLKPYEKYIKQLDKNFNKHRTLIYESDPKSDYTSYSVNKGQEISFCLKSKTNDKLHNINLLMYVAIHEMAHIACPEIGHGELFRHIFKKFVEEAIIIGIYKKVNFNEFPVEYCGMILSSSVV